MPVSPETGTMANVSSGPRGTGTGRGQIFSAPDAAQDGKWCPAGLGSQWASQKNV